MHFEYIPGVCNIGKQGRVARFLVGIVFIGIAALGFVLLVRTGVPAFYRAVLIIPLYVGFLSIMEAVTGFCVFFARRRRYDMR